MRVSFGHPTTIRLFGPPRATPTYRENNVNKKRKGHYVIIRLAHFFASGAMISPMNSVAFPGGRTNPYVILCTVSLIPVNCMPESTYEVGSGCLPVRDDVEDAEDDGAEVDGGWVGLEDVTDACSPINSMYDKQHS
jgi:hypothetical protein